MIRVVTEIERGVGQFRTENKIKKYVEKGTNSRNIFSRLQQKTIARAHSSSFFADFADFLLFSAFPPLGILSTSGRQSVPFICEIESLRTPVRVFSADTYTTGQLLASFWEVGESISERNADIFIFLFFSFLQKNDQVGMMKSELVGAPSGL